MTITIAEAMLPHLDPEGSIGFYRDLLGFELRNDVGYAGMRWLTLGPADQPYAMRDCAFRDPAGNLVRIRQAS